MAPRTDERQQVSARRAAILEAAALEFAARGFEGTRATDVARRAGVASGTVFYHFGDKATLFREIFATDLPRARELARQARRLTDPLRAVLHLVDGLSADVTTPGAALLAAELVRRTTVDEQLARVVVETDETTRTALTELIERGTGSGRFDPTLNPSAAAATVLAMVDGAYLHGDPEHDPRPGLRRAVAAYLCSPDPTRNLDD